jgi:multiple sugar transport system ATP-binding protein
MSMASIALEAVTKSYGTTLVVDRVDLDIIDGEFLVLVGPSGCGKTTTLRMIAGLESISSGTVKIGDRVVNDVEPKDRDIGMVFQNYALYPHMSVYENMSFGLRLHNVGKDEIDRRITETAELLGLTAVLKRKPKALSGGQRQRVALGRAIVREPSVFLMDEPLSNLDAKLRVQTRTEILRLHKRLGNTVVYVTHDQVEAMTMAHRIVVMKDGVVQQFATPRELYSNPVNSFVAGFIGSPQMNFVNVDLERTDGSVVAHSAGGNVAVPASRVNGATGSAILGIRPEDVLLSHSANGTSLPATVDVIETLGSEQYVFLKLSAGAQIVSRVAGDFDIKAGQSVAATLLPEKLHLFERDSGKAIARG